MAANQFATLLHRSTHRVVVVLVYTVLEWILIALLLLNSLFSYLISKFAAYFGLRPPCIFCSRVDHLFEGRGGGGPSIAAAHRDLICDTHAAEVSRLGYCSNHRRLADAGGMCDGCSSSLPSPLDRCRQQTVALLSVVEEEGAEASRCSCCSAELESSGFYSPYLFFKPSWGVLGYKDEIFKEKEGYQDEIFKEKEGYQDEIFKEDETRLVEEAKVLPPVSADDVRVHRDEENGVGGEHIAVEGNEERDDTSLPLEDPAALVGRSDDPFYNREERDESLEILNKGRDFTSDGGIERLLPVELIDSTTLKNLEKLSPSREEEGEHGGSEAVIEGAMAEIGIVFMDEHVEAQEDVVSPLPKTFESQEDVVPPLIKIVEAQEEVVYPQMEIVEIQEEVVCPQVEIVQVQEEVASSPVPEETDCARESFSVVAAAEEIEGVPQDPQKTPTVPHGGTCEVEAAVVDCEENQASEEDNKMMDGEANCEVSIGSEICDQEQIDQGNLHDELPPLIDLRDYSSDNLNDAPDENQATIIEVEPIQAMDRELRNHLPISSEQTEVEEERPPETPSSVEGLHNLHKRFLFDRRECGTESLDGSVASEADGSDILTVDHLKAALKSERKVLSVLYAELEEERSASAIAANQTMAMITRLQEEKAAMQMEALQYQRMMEEQSEYDQEALQLLNELMVKREKEKQDLEKELEVYRKKILLYEAKERRRLKKGKATGRSGTSSASSSAEDSDDLSLELNDSDENIDGVKESNQNTPADIALSTGQETTKHLVTVDESLADFEEERLSIIEQLKALEEKLFTLDDGERCPENLEVSMHFLEENGDLHDRDHEFHNSDINGYENGFMEDLNSNGKHHRESTNVLFHGKRLLPLFDAVSVDNEDGIHEETETMGFSQGSLPNLINEQKKLAIAEEVDNVYERLQALEADTEFLKHCISSLKRGEKGMDLLQEILQHLRDLRSVELRVKNAGDAFASFSS